MRNNRIVILDYNLGNLFSVKHACERVGLDPLISTDKKDLLNADTIILPGVGAFGDAMKNLKKFDLISPLKDKVKAGTPLIGVCLGLHLLFEGSEENGNHKGLGLIKGVIKKLPTNIDNRDIKVPNIGWNTIFSDSNRKWNNSLLNDLKQNSFMYFVHSYYANPKDNCDILTMTNYEGFEYCSSIEKGNISAFQFHPEKSGIEGLKIYNKIKNRYYDTK